MTVLHGSCHCGSVEVAFETAIPVDELTIRACACSFCRRHNVKAIADANGHLTIAAAPDALHRYRFGLHTADYLICKTCGVYVAAVIGTGAEARSTLNVVGNCIAGLADRPAQAVDYDMEDGAARRARRITTWTPTEFSERNLARGVG
jgi:hypothetical protein